MNPDYYHYDYTGLTSGENIMQIDMVVFWLTESKVHFTSKVIVSPVYILFPLFHLIPPFSIHFLPILLFFVRHISTTS